MKPILIWLMHSRPYKWLILQVIPFIRFTLYYTSLRGESYHHGYAWLRPGDFILAVDKKKMTSFLVPGVFTHAALCVGRRDKVEGFEVVEMTHHNFTRSDFFDVCKESDRVAIFTCTDWEGEYRQAVIAAAWSMQDAVYDVEFTLGVEALYCSELVYQADQKAGGKLQCDLTDIHGLGRPYISPNGLATAKNVVCLWDSDGEYSALKGPEIERRMCK